MELTGTNRPRTWSESTNRSVLAMECSRSIHIFAVAIAPGNHPFPFRTRKLSPVAPMVLGGQPPGRVGHCRINQEEDPHCVGVFFVTVRSVPRRPGPFGPGRVGLFNCALRALVLASLARCRMTRLGKVPPPEAGVGRQLLAGAPRSWVQGQHGHSTRRVGSGSTAGPQIGDRHRGPRRMEVWGCQTRWRRLL